jgi:hypothetical protein
MARHQGLALALLPAVAIGSWRGSLQLAVVALVADAGTLRATAERLGQAAGLAFKDVLVDVLSARPGEAAGVVAADHM